jgi:hypothetical protein
VLFPHVRSAYCFRHKILLIGNVALKSEVAPSIQHKKLFCVYLKGARD